MIVNWVSITLGVFTVAGVAFISVCAIRNHRLFLRSFSSRGEMAEAPEIETISEDAVHVQSCAIDASGLTEPEAACLRRNHLHMSEEDRYDLDLTFASIVTPEEVETVTELTLAEVLRKGADYMEQHGWIREDYGDKEGGVCLLGACAVALGRDPLIFMENYEPVGSLFFAAAKAIREELDIHDEDPDVRAVINWNDEHCPDEEFAVALLRAAAEAVSA